MEQKQWWKEAVGYQIYLKSFYDSNGDGVGDIAGVINKLDYIKNLGVDFIWISPFFDSPMDDNGYDIRDYKKVLSEFGTLEDVKALIKRAHSMGLKVIIDMVINHTSIEHAWFTKSVARATDYEDYYYWQDPKFDANGKMIPPNNWESFFGGSAWAYNEKRGQYFLKIFSSKMPDVNFNSKKAIENYQEIMDFWIGLGVDGFRMDAISHIGKDENFSDGKKGKTYLKFSNLDSTHKFLNEVLKGKKSDVVTMGELGGEPTFSEQLRYTNPENSELNMIFDFSHLNNFNAKTGKINYSKIIKALKQKSKLSSVGGWSVLFWTNHDYQRLASMYGNTKALAKSTSAFATAMYLLNGTPIIYQGEELAMTGYPFKSEQDFVDVNALQLLSLAETEEEKKKVLENLINSSRDNARTCMQWNGSINAGFSEGTPWFKVNPNYHSLNVAVEQTEEHSALNEYRKIIALRKQFKDSLCYGSCKFLHAPKGVVRYLRNSGNEEFEIIVNLTDEVKKFLLPAGEIMYTNYGEVIRGELSPYEAVVLKRKVIQSK